MPPILMTIQKSWRDDPGLIYETEYKKKFAWLPVKITGETKIWLKPFYRKYHNWGHSTSNKRDDKYECMYHRDFVENITEDEYLVRKLADTL